MICRALKRLLGGMEEGPSTATSWPEEACISMGLHFTVRKDECEYLISLAKSDMQNSTLVDSTTGKSKDSRVRTSSGMFLKRKQDKIISSIEQRIADFTFIPMGVMLKKVVRLCFHQSKLTKVLFLIGMSCLNAAKLDLQLGQRWVMLCSSGA